jgi:hypothetical protein
MMKWTLNGLAHHLADRQIRTQMPAIRTSDLAFALLGSVHHHTATEKGYAPDLSRFDIATERQWVPTGMKRQPC